MKGIKEHYVCLAATLIIHIFAGNQDLRASSPPPHTTSYPSVLERLPDEYPDLKQQISKLESQLFDRPKRKSHQPLTPVIAEANDRLLQGIEKKKSLNILFSGFTALATATTRYILRYMEHTDPDITTNTEG